MFKLFSSHEKLYANTSLQLSRTVINQLEKCNRNDMYYMMNKPIMLMSVILGEGFFLNVFFK